MNPDSEPLLNSASFNLAESVASVTNAVGSVTNAIQDLQRAIDDEANQQAAAIIFKHYSQQLAQRLDKRINARLKSVHDSEDMGAFALTKVLSGLKEGAFPSLRNRDSLWALLLHIGNVRIREVWRHETALRRDIRRSIHASLLGGQDDNKTDDTPAFDPQAADLPPDVVTRLRESMGAMLESLPDDRARSILIMELQGYTPAEIHKELEESEGRPIAARTLRNWRKTYRQVLAEHFSDEFSDFEQLFNQAT